GHATAAQVVAEAETRQRQQLSSLDQERQALESRVNELRTFEREYRQKLKGYIEGQLLELESAAAVSAEVGPNQLTAAAAPSAAAPSEATPPAYYAPQAPGQLPGGNYTGFAGS
ncbi:MAG: cell division protein, partial [Salinibacterium sp.]|nr:cell division protein [Salinibacterium sp.]